MITIVLTVFSQAMAQQTNPTQGGSSSNRYKWNMFGLNRVHIQDFGLTDQYAENGNAAGLNGFLVVCTEFPHTIIKADNIYIHYKALSSFLLACINKF
jgi:hypothetical protein